MTTLSQANESIIQHVLNLHFKFNGRKIVVSTQCHPATKYSDNCVKKNKKTNKLDEHRKGRPSLTDYAPCHQILPPSGVHGRWACLHGLTPWYVPLGRRLVEGPPTMRARHQVWVLSRRGRGELSQILSLLLILGDLLGVA